VLHQRMAEIQAQQMMMLTNQQAPGAGPSPSGQSLSNGAPVTDNHSPQQGV
jgi:hypothetical protein